MIKQMCMFRNKNTGYFSTLPHNVPVLIVQEAKNEVCYYYLDKYGEAWTISSSVGEYTSLLYDVKPTDICLFSSRMRGLNLDAMWYHLVLYGKERDYDKCKKSAIKLLKYV